ncbi:MAG: DUF1624 domain-containing protein [Oscillospiraceae bacterium]|nr:DUF1624 domain-containing protein [Oscillospiraceae bacterium]
MSDYLDADTLRRERIELIDTLRGLSVVLMVAHHFLYNLVYFLGAPGWLFSNPVFDVLHYIFAGLFIALSGVSSRFSQSNVKRGLKVIALAICITVVTHFMDMPIIFGILHLLGFSMLFFGLTSRLWDKIPVKATPFIYAALIIASALATAHFTPASNHLWMFGWPGPGFLSYDYFPILPWFFVFMFGTSLGVYINAHKFPAWFYKTYNIPVFPKVGRRALLIYILHQPILYTITMGIRWIIR